jgi:hypothetical protein
MNWKNFCGKLADAGDALSLHPAVPVSAESVDGQQLPFLPDVFGICQDRHWQIWRGAWRLVGD